MLWCDECQRKRSECDEDEATPCAGRIEREYNKAMSRWEQSADWIADGTDIAK